MPDLPDVNVWLALAADGHEHHLRAKQYWELEAASVLVFCRVTQLAFLRHLTNPAIMTKAVLSPAAAWAKYRDFASLPEIQFYGEPPQLDDWLLRFSDIGRTSPNLWTDAYLAGFAKAASLRFVSFDTGFKRFAGLETLILKR